MSPRVWHINNRRCPADAVYCGRGGPYGNPYVIGKHGTRDQVCNNFRDLILPTLDVSGLKGKDLKCYCKPNRCHADDILIKANCSKGKECKYPKCSCLLTRTTVSVESK